MSFPPKYRARSRVDLSGEESRAEAVAVAARTGLSQPGPLHHFPGKAALLAAVIDGVRQQWLPEPDRMSMTAEFEAFVATLRARWSTVESG